MSKIPLWKVFVLFFACMVAAGLTVGTLNHFFAWGIPQWVVGALGGFLGVVFLQLLRRKSN